MPSCRLYQWVQQQLYAEKRDQWARRTHFNGSSVNDVTLEGEGGALD